MAQRSPLGCSSPTLVHNQKPAHLIHWLQSAPLLYIHHLSHHVFQNWASDVLVRAAVSHD